MRRTAFPGGPSGAWFDTRRLQLRAQPRICTAFPKPTPADISAMLQQGNRTIPAPRRCCIMKPDFDQYFRVYTDLYNQALTAEPDYEAIMAHFATCFIAAGPDGVRCGENDETFHNALKQGYDFYRKIGAKRMSVRRCETTKIDDTHAMVRVFYSADYDKNGKPITIYFDLTYMIDHAADAPKIFAFVAGDEMAVFKQHGLID
jgi:hypothetical protein